MICDDRKVGVGVKLTSIAVNPVRSFQHNIVL